MLILFYFVVTFLFILSFVSLEDDAYLDKLPTFERNIDSFAGIVTSTPDRRSWLVIGDGGFDRGLGVPTHSALGVKRSKAFVETTRITQKHRY